ALHLAKRGADIAIIDRNLNAAEVYEFERSQMTAPTVVEECEALGRRAFGIEADLTNRSAAETAIAQVVEKLGRLDVAVCNAGGGTVTFADEREAEPGANDQADLVTTGTPSDCRSEERRVGQEGRYRRSRRQYRQRDSEARK